MKMFRHLFRKLDQIMDGRIISKDERFFSSIYGYDDIKKLLMRCIFTKEPTHVILTGPPGCCKTMFVLEIAKALDKTYFMDATSASGPGMIDYLFENNIKYLLIDEIDNDEPAGTVNDSCDKNRDGLRDGSYSSPSRYQRYQRYQEIRKAKLTEQIEKILVSELNKKDCIKLVKQDKKQNENKKGDSSNEEKECYILFRKDLGIGFGLSLLGIYPYIKKRGSCQGSWKRDLKYWELLSVK